MTGVASRTIGRASAKPKKPPHVYDALVIGAGFAGLGSAIKLREKGIEDVLIVERGDRVGGTWRDNTYPGIACDIPSYLYSFSFAPNPHWSRAYPSGAEIQAYVESLADRFGLRPLIRFGTEVRGLTFVEETGIWEVRTNKRGVLRARTVIGASGPLSDASLPDIRGIERYEGTKLLSARWDHSVDLRGKRVGVIGTGASAIQIIPELVDIAESVKVFQRTPGWVMPRPNPPIPAVASAVFKRLPLAQQAVRTSLFWSHEVAATGLVWDTPVTTAVQQLGRAHLRMSVKDPWLRRQLTPDFRAGCKRMLVSSDYYPALQRDNCKLITWPIATMNERGLATSDGIEHDLDAIVFATGYDVHLDGPPYEVRGLDGRLLSDAWTGHAEAFKSVHTHGFPNLFFTTGPNSGPGHNSLLVYLEGQIDYIVKGVRQVIENDLLYLDVRADVQRRHNASLQRRLGKTTWMSGCSSWYLTADGFNASMYPGFATQYRAQMARFDTRHYELRRRPAAELWNVPAAVV